MSLDTIKNELDEMGVDYSSRDARMTADTELIIPMETVSPSQARQIEFLCTSNEGIVSKKQDEGYWTVSEL